MFESKKSSLIEVPKKASTASGTTASDKNPFLNAGRKKTAEARSGNNAKKYVTTGNEFVDQFTSMGDYKKPRSFKDIATSISTLWAIDKRLTIMFTLFLRTISRVVQFFDGSKTSTTQRGGGLKHESIFRMLWIATNHEDSFWKNIQLFITVGSWKDIFEMLRYDLEYNGWDDKVLDWDKMSKLIMAGLENPNVSNLVKKYLPQIKANSQCTTLRSQANNIIAKYLASQIFGNKDSESKTYAQYRKMKVSGNAHTWQQLISQGKHALIDFDSVHGRALSQMVSSKYIKNQGLEQKYQEWIESKPVAKYTGYVYELCSKITGNMKPFQITTFNKQFLGLVETAQKGANKHTGLIVVRDTSGSMSARATGTNMSAGNIAKSLALFFSYMLPEGPFANSWIEFRRNAELRDWKGSTPYEKWMNDGSSFIGTTNFLSVINLLANIKNQGVDEAEFPTGILCISDGQFNPGDLGKTNVDSAYDRLRLAGFSEDYISNFQIILWDIPNSYYGRSTPKFETFGDRENIFYLSGYDPTIAAFITGVETKEGAVKTPKNATELFNAAMDQEVLNLVEV